MYPAACLLAACFFLSLLVLLAFEVRRVYLFIVLVIRAWRAHCTSAANPMGKKIQIINIPEVHTATSKVMSQSSPTVSTVPRSTVLQPSPTANLLDPPRRPASRIEGASFRQRPGMVALGMPLEKFRADAAEADKPGVMGAYERPRLASTLPGGSRADAATATDGPQ